jgi:hypothetical protein
MRTVILLLIIIIISLPFSGCKKCVQNQIADLKFTQDELKIDPYTGNELLTFIGSSGDTVLFHNGSRLNSHLRIYQYDYETAKLDHDGCQGDYFEIDQDQMMMYDDTLETHLYIFLNFQYSWSSPSNEKIFKLSFGQSKQLFIYFNGSFKFNVDTLLNITMTSQYYKDSIIAFHPIWKSGPNTFNNVYELYSHQPDNRYTPWISIAYYSINEGLLGFKTTSGITWNLKK